jgi:hypothetical protein
MGQQAHDLFFQPQKDLSTMPYQIPANSDIFSYNEEVFLKTPQNNGNATKPNDYVPEESPLPPAIEAIDIQYSAIYNKQINMLREVLVLAENAQDLNDPYHRIKIMARLSWGLRKAGEFLGVARTQYKLAYAARKKAEGIAALENFANYIASRKSEGKEAKATEEMRKHYIHLDVNVHAAVSKEAYMEAVLEQLQTYKQEFFMALSLIKASSYGVHTQETNLMSGASVAVNDGE